MVSLTAVLHLLSKVAGFGGLHIVWAVFVPFPILSCCLRLGFRHGVIAVICTMLMICMMLGLPSSIVWLLNCGLLALQMGWMWKRGCSFWSSVFAGTLIHMSAFFLQISAWTLILGENLFLVIFNAIQKMMQSIFEIVLRRNPVQAKLVPLVLVVTLLFLSVHSFLFVLDTHLLCVFVGYRTQLPLPSLPGWLRLKKRNRKRRAIFSPLT